MKRVVYEPNGNVDKLIRPGCFVYYRGRTWRIASQDKANPLIIELEDTQSHDLRPTRVQEFFNPVEDGQPEPLFASTLDELQTQIAQRRSPPPQVGLSDNLPEFALKKADALINTVEIVRELIEQGESIARLRGDKTFNRTQAIKDACKELGKHLRDRNLDSTWLHGEGIGLTAYYKYLRAYKENYGIKESIAASLRRSNQPRMDKAQLHLMDTLILRYYARSIQRFRPLSVFRIAKDTLVRTNGLWLDPRKCKGDNPSNLAEELLSSRIPMETILSNPEKKNLLTPIKTPSRAWFYNYLKWYEAQPEQGREMIDSRYGEGTYERERMIFDTFVTRASMPLQYVFADHYLLDVFIVDEETRRQPDRLWLTVLIDAYSRSILGMALLYENPCIESIQTALRHAIWSKKAPSGGDTREWACYGIPQQLSLDNAWAHQSHSLESLSRAISHGGRYTSIDLDWRPPYKANRGALVERYFGNLSGKIKELLPGAIRSSKPQDVQNAARNASLLYRDIDEFIHKMILEYQHSPHSELGGMTPHDKWLEGIRLGFPQIPAWSTEMDRLFWRLYPSTRVIGQKGVSAFGLHYYSNALGDAERMGTNGKPVQYNFRYQPEDINRIALFRNDAWVGDVFAKELRLPNGETRSISLAELEMAKDLSRGQGRRTQDLLAIIDDLDETIRTRTEEKKKAHQVPQKAKSRKPSSAEVTAVNEAVERISPDDGGDDYTALLTKFARGQSTRDGSAVAKGE